MAPYTKTAISLIQKTLRLAGYRLVRSKYLNPDGLPIDYTPDEIQVIRAVAPYTRTGPERIQALVQATSYIAGAGLPGAFVECGVWKGGSMMAVASTLKRLGQTGRDLYLFDTFEGMTAPTEVDRSLHGQTAAQMMAATQPNAENIWALAPLDEVRKNMAGTGYPADRIHYKQGKVEDTLPGEAPDQIALLRLDTDWYESTRHEMEHLFPRLVPGGVLIVDDYGHWEGSRRAVDEYVEQHGLRLLFHRMDYSARLAIKQG
jgi:O-methyltransferase